MAIILAPHSLLLDFSKAFDTINHIFMLSNLSFSDLDEKSLLLFMNYFSKRIENVRYEGSQSGTRALVQGVTKGSVRDRFYFLFTHIK